MFLLRELVLCAPFSFVTIKSRMQDSGWKKSEVPLQGQVGGLRSATLDNAAGKTGGAEMVHRLSHGVRNATRLCASA